MKRKYVVEKYFVIECEEKEVENVVKKIDDLVIKEIEEVVEVNEYYEVEEV